MLNIPDKLDLTTTLPAAQFNSMLNELENIITSSAQTLSGSDLYQISKAMANYAAVSTFYTDSGAANAYVLTPVGALKSPDAYYNGMLIRYRPGANNTGASTVTVGTLGSKSIKQADGVTDPAAGEILTTRDAELRYDGTVFRISIISQATESVSGIAEIATQAETNAGTDDLRFLTPLKLKDRLLLNSTFESAQQTITLGGALTIPHALGTIPKLVQCWLVCQVADVGYAVGDRVLLSWTSGDSWGVSIVPDAINLNIRFGTASLMLLNKTSGNGSVLTTASWKAIFTAIKI